MKLPKWMNTPIILGAVVLGLLFLALLTLWWLPSWLTQHPRLSAPADRYKAAADARTGVVAFVAVLGGLGGLYYTSRSFQLTREAQNEAQKHANQTARLNAETLALTERGQNEAQKHANETARLNAETLALTERGQITDRYAKAVEMLGSSSNEICVGGVYALGHIMLDSPAYERAIVSVLSAFIRHKAKRTADGRPPWPEDEAERDEVKPSFSIQAALNVFIESRPSATPPDLRDSDLRGARLRKAQLQGANFRRSYLYKAKLQGANLSEATFGHADLTEADLSYANMFNANLRDAQLTYGALNEDQLRNVRNKDKIVWVPKKDDKYDLDLDLSSTGSQTPDPL